MTTTLKKPAEGDNPNPEGGEDKPAVVVNEDGSAAHVGGEEPEKGEVTPMPEGGHDKFYNKDTGEYDWKSHAVEADFKAKQAAEKAAEKPAGEEKPGEGEGDPIKTAVEAAGLDFAEIDKQIADHGDLTEEQYKAFESIGIPRERVQGVVSMTKEGLDEHTSAVMTAFGGEAEFNKVVDWADQNMTGAEIDAFDARINNAEQRDAAIAEIRSKMGLPPLAEGPGLRAGPNKGGPSVPGEKMAFASQEELQAAIQDPRYKTDPEYRASVTDRAARSTYHMNPRFHTP